MLPEIDDREDQEPDASVQTPPTRVKSRARRRSLAKLPRELGEVDLKSPAVQKLLIDEIERLENELESISPYRTMYHEMDKQVEVLKEKFKIKISIEVLQTGCITIGAAAIGYSPAVTAGYPTSTVILIFGAVLVSAGLLAKAVRI
ncbi:MAG: hypothetical protein IH621_03070 [Krumholzibacteria bacterium]|nr:hypothetical protein [Candidatus Krumholzibacteria bacterium]